MNIEALFQQSDRIALLRVRIIRYLVSGGLAATANFSTLYILTDIAGVWYLFSSIAAVTVGFGTSFLLQKFWTFRNMPLSRVHIQLSMHVTLSLANIAVNTVALYVLVEYVHLWYLFAQFLSAAVLASGNYFLYRRYIFRSQEPLSSDTGTA